MLQRISLTCNRYAIEFDTVMLDSRGASKKSQAFRSQCKGFPGKTDRQQSGILRTHLRRDEILGLCSLNRKARRLQMRERAWFPDGCQN